MRNLLTLLIMAWFGWMLYRLLKNTQPKADPPPKRKKVESSIVEKNEPPESNDKP